jgi:23S rRNA pseudouridine2605 synthase
MSGPGEGTQEGAGSVPLQKWLMAARAGSKAQVRGWIAAGAVSVDGEVCTRFAAPVSPGQRVEVEGEAVVAVTERVVLLMNKPIKHVTAAEDPEGRPSLGQYLPEGLARVFPVGRLDYNTEGALLWTNDGLLARRVLHPSHALPKVYHVKIRGHLGEDDPGFARMRAGMDLGDFVSQPAQVRWLAPRTRATWVEIVIQEGKFRQVRRMCQLCGYQLVKLRRVAIGPVLLGDLNPRCVRALEADELRALEAALGLEAEGEEGEWGGE